MNLIVPVDFSEQSRSAAEFAASMSRLHGGNLHLVHVLVPIDDEPEYLPLKAMDVKYNTVFEMYALQEKLRKTYDVRTSCDLVPGDITEQIISAARRTKADLIIMGNQGNSGLRKHLYGSHSTSVMDTSPVPVLTLPEGFVFNELRRMVYATDYSYSNLADIKGIADIARMFDAVISLIHVKKNSINSMENSRYDFEELIRANVDYDNISFDACDNTDTAEGLSKLLRAQHADVLIIPNRRRSLAEKTPGRTESEAFVFDLDIPLLVY